MPMRRESSTVVSLVGTLSDEPTTAFGQSPNVTVIPPSASKVHGAADVRAGQDRPGWEPRASSTRAAWRTRRMPVRPLVLDQLDGKILATQAGSVTAAGGRTAAPRHSGC